MNDAHPLALLGIGAALVASAAALTAPSRQAPPAPPLPSATPSAVAVPIGAAACPRGTLPDDGVCIPVPQGAPSAEGAASGPELPRRPGQPASLSAYHLPVDTDDPGNGALPPALLAHEAEPRGGAFVTAPVGSPVVVPRLADQKGPTELLAAVELFGPTAITLHHVVAGDRERTYVLLVGNLQELPAQTPGAIEGAFGRAGSGASGGTPGIYLELRRARAGFDVRGARVDDLRRPENTVTVDARNALPLRP